MLAPWKVELIAHRARAFGFRADQVPDLQQRIVPQLIELVFDPQHAAGASERTFVRKVIDRQLMRIMRDRTRDVRRVSHETVSFADRPLLTEKEFFAQDPWPDAQLHMDLVTVLRELTDVQRAVCMGLVEGHTQADIARATGRSKAAVSAEVRRVREVFRQWGMDAYLDGKGRTS